MSCLVLAAAAAPSAPCPMTYSRTRPFAICAGLIALDADLVPQLLGDVAGAGVVEVQPQRHHVRAGRAAVAAGRDWAPPSRSGTSAAIRLQLRDRSVHVLVAGVRAGRRDQRQRRRALVGVVRPRAGRGPRSDWEPATSKPPPVRWPDWVIAR